MVLIYLLGGSHLQGFANCNHAYRNHNGDDTCSFTFSSPFLMKQNIIDSVCKQRNLILKDMPIPDFKEPRGQLIENDKIMYYDSVNLHILNNGFEKKIGPDTLNGVIRELFIDLNGTDYCSVVYSTIDKDEILLSILTNRNMTVLIKTYWLNNKIIKRTTEEASVKLGVFIWKDQIILGQYIGDSFPVLFNMTKTSATIHYRHGENEMTMFLKVDSSKNALRRLRRYRKLAKKDKK
jgi:hypothetical protein